LPSSVFRTRRNAMTDPGGAAGIIPVADGLAEVELAEAEILDAMRRVPGYIDITTADFQAIYHLAHTHAVERLFRGLRAGDLMRPGLTPLDPATPLGAAAR
jgi:CBS domain-containing membrane protein